MRLIPLPLLLLALLFGRPVSADEQSDDLLRSAREALAAGKSAEAVALLDKAIKLDPKQAPLYVVRGQAHDALGKYDEAVKDFTRAVELEPKRADAYDRRGSAYFKLGEFAKSVADFDRYLALKPEQKAGHWRRGISCYYARQYDEGRKQFEGYESVDTNDVENAVWRFLCMVPQVGLEKSRAAMLKIGRDRRVPMTEVYEMFCGRMKPADVLKAAEAGSPDAEQLNRRRFYAHLYLGLYYEALGDSKRALKHLTTAADHRIGHYMWDVARVHRDTLRRAATEK